MDLFCFFAGWVVGVALWQVLRMWTWPGLRQVSNSLIRVGRRLGI